ncbi:MAG TPA: UPF0158 family protein [Pyrinomonadaceae bacterium]|nr:UPF0158 family protein [Pyrinomonadaceae bacterium]
MTRISIDAEELIMALDHHGDESEWLLDLQTGEVLFVADEGLVGPDEDLAKQIEREPDRYRAIDPIPSSDGWEIMAEFIEQLPAGEARAHLTRALQHNHPFRSFKNALLDYPKLREEWFAFHEKSFMQLAREWLDDESIDADLKSRVAGDA